MTEIKNERLRELQRKAEATARGFEEGKKRLLRPDGSPLFTADVHREEMDKLARERNAVLLEVEQEAREIRTGAADALERLGSADPLDLLGEEELERANARRAFALDAAEGLSAEDLGKRLQSVLEGGDKASIFAYLLAGQRRQQAILERRRNRAEGELGNGRATSPVPGVTPLDGVLEEMHKALGGEEREAELEAAGSLGREASEVEYLAANLRFEGRGAYQPNLAVPGPSAEADREVGRLARVR